MAASLKGGRGCHRPLAFNRTVQHVTEYLGFTRPGFALASCLSIGEIAEDLDFDLRMVLQLELDVVDPAALELDAPDDMRHSAFLHELFEQCHVQALVIVQC